MKNIVIDNNNFTILEGTKGVYPISDIVKMSIVCEDAHYKGKTDPFNIWYWMVKFKWAG